jgi:exopolysaccharide biosynthesis protein
MTRQSAKTVLFGGNGKRLPTEAEFTHNEEFVLEEDLRLQLEAILLEELGTAGNENSASVDRPAAIRADNEAAGFCRKRRPMSESLPEEGLFLEIEAQLAQAIERGDEAPRTRGKRRPGKVKRRLIAAACAAGLLGGLYLTAIYSDIPFIEKWRDIYIGTAMQTFNHKWLATSFIPADVIGKVMAEQDAVIAAQQGLESTWKGAGSQPKPNGAKNGTMTKAAFFKEFKQLDLKSFNAYVKANPDALKNGYGKLLINRAGLKNTGTTIKTTAGDQVLAIDAENGILIVKVTGDGYVGKLAIVEDPSAVSVAAAKTIGKSGQSVAQIAEANDAVLAVNASGFADYQGMGNGGKVVGLLIADGKKMNAALGGTYKNIGFGKDDRLYIGVSTKDMTYRDAVQFLPALVVNGVDVIEGKTFKQGTTAFGIQPRTAIGQAEDGTVLLLTIDGRKTGYSLGCTVEECADILMRYGAVQASNLDGGSSTVMVYKGNEITDPADNTDYGRLVPDAIIVKTYI